MTFTLTFHGHATFSLQSGETHILTDLNVSKTVGLLKRRQGAVFDPLSWKHLTAALVTNAHYHRLDIPSYRYLPISTPILTPKNLDSYLMRRHGGEPKPLKPGERFETKDVLITALKATHKGARLTSLRYPHSLHYLIEIDGKTIFYAGDSAYGQDFALWGQQYTIDLAILPIDFVGLESVSLNRYLTAETAWRAFLDLKAKQLVPNAFGSFVTYGRDPGAAPKRLLELASADSMTDKVSLLAPGQMLSA
jgi:L-ascorbate metabolism protein UlaG (beta-lactamase superfamily)